MEAANQSFSDYSKIAKEVFTFLTENFNYKFVETIDEKFLVRHTYRNRWRRRKIVIENQSFPGDYGFSFWIYNLLTKEKYLLHNTWLEEDKMSSSLNLIKNKIISNTQFVNLIKGKNWKVDKIHLPEF